MWSRVKVQSCADGTLHIYPRWRKNFKQHGLITRMHGAYCLQGHLNKKLKGSPSD